MGLNYIFKNTAHFDNLYYKSNESKARPFVTSILQKSGIEIDEEGSVAAASTRKQKKYNPKICSNYFRIFQR